MLLKNIIGKNVRVGIAFIGGVNKIDETTLGGTKYYDGIITDYDGKFMSIDNEIIINIDYIQVIEIID